MKALTWLTLPVMAFLLSTGAGAQNIWINEIHYDNAGPDTGEFLEVVLENPAGYNLADFSVTLYNGNNGTAYDTRTLDSFTQGSSVGNFTFYWLDYDSAGGSIQNGAPDGMALAWLGNLVSGQFLSYEGTFTAADGPANGITSTDIGVSESSSTPAGYSLQLSGSGNGYSSFAWQVPAPATPGIPDSGQVLGGGVLPEPTDYPSGFTASAGRTSVTLTWTDATGGQIPKFCLVKGSVNDSADFPVDGVPEPDDSVLGDGSGEMNIPRGTQTCTFSNLESNTTYFFWIFPYTNTGSDINYKTDGFPPFAQATTPDTATSAGAGTGQGSFRLFPNPAGEKVWISTGCGLPCEIRILDIAGRIRTEIRNSSPETMLDTGGLAPGIYTVSVKESGTGQTFLRKLIIR